MPKLRFSVDSALLSELGEKLVESVHVALLELIKNAYDADATEVTVEVTPAGDKYRIVVSDNGEGMSFDDVQNYWMRIATTHKAEDNVSERFGRIKSGSKGIGRFSCRRLGSKLVISSTAELAKGKYEKTEMEIDWTRYEPGMDVDTITCECTVSHHTTGSTGVELTILNCPTAEWSRRGWKVLKRRLMLLVSNRGVRREGYKADPGFNVSLVAPDFEKTKLVNQRELLMDAGWGRLKMAIDADGEVLWTLDAKRIGTRKMTMPERHPELAGTSADIAILPDRKEQFREPSHVALGKLREVLPEWGGVHVRKHGIRIYPYGEPGNDWLNIDHDRGLRRGPVTFAPVKELARQLQGVDETRALLNILSARSYVGDVNLVSVPVQTGDSLLDPFELKANREGFVGEAGISKLRDLTRFGIDWSTVLRDYYLRLEEHDAIEDARDEFEDVADESVPGDDLVDRAISYIEQEMEYAASRLPRKERARVIDTTRTAAKAVRATLRSHQHELRHLRLIAATSSLLLIFSHEVKSLLGMLDSHKVTILDISENVSRGVSERLQGLAGSFSETKERFQELLGMTSSISADEASAKPAKLSIIARAERAAKCFQLISKKYKIEIDLTSIPSGAQIGPMVEAELYSVLLNALSNSIKSVIAGGKDRRIAVRASTEDGSTRLQFLDSGIGVTDPEEVFTAFHTEPQLYRRLKRRLNSEDEYIVGTGSGLGLTIIRDIAAARGGSAAFVDPPAGWKCSLEVQIPCAK